MFAMRKRFEIVPRCGSWDVVHNHVGFRLCATKRDAIRLALSLGRMQLRMGDDAEVVLRDELSGAPRATRHYVAQPDQAVVVRHINDPEPDPQALTFAVSIG